MENIGKKMNHDGIKNKHAIIIGGSIGGCLAAEVLSEYFDKITILEKGSFDDEMNDRQSVPQEKHVHVLLHKGEKIIESILPSIKDDLRNERAVDIDLGKDTEWFQFGLWKKHYDIGLKSIFFSRRLLDSSIRKRISRNPKTTIQPESTVKDYLFNTENNNTKILGVKISTPIGINDLFGDIVIDASGLGSRTSNLLSAIGLGEVTKEQIRTNLGYVSRLYRRKPEHG